MAGNDFPVTLWPRYTRPNALIDQQNMQTVASAFVRGDLNVCILNTDWVPVGMLPLRRVHHQPIPNNHAYEATFADLASRHENEGAVDEQQLRSLFDGERFFGMEFEFVKALGVGGFGVATLWNVQMEGGVSHKVVIKLGVHRSFNPQKEEKWHLRYWGSQNTVQVLDLAGMAHKATAAFQAANPTKPLQYSQGEEWDLTGRQMMILEYACHGDFLSLVQKATRHNVVFGDRALWGLWECLVKGLAAIAYSDSFASQGLIFGEEFEETIENGTLPVFLRSLEKHQVAHHAHFDIEESNILVGSAAGTNVPVLKIHDFGEFSYDMREAWQYWDVYKYWKLRSPCKMNRVTPEQVHGDWDELSTNDPNLERNFQGENLLQGNPIAGRYGMWSSIHLVAKSMEAAITGLFTSHPMNSTEYTTLDESTQAKTYGWRLNRPEYHSTDSELRDVLCQCLFERPVDRPDVLSLLRKIQSRKQRPFKQTVEQNETF